MKRVADHVQRKSWQYYGSIFFLFSISFVVIFGYMRILVCPSLNKIQITRSNIGEWMLYFLLAGIEFAIICIWFYYAPIVLRELENLRSAFSKVREYDSLYQSYRRWMKQFDLCHPGINRLFKVFYFIFWALFLLDAWGLTWTIFGKR